MPNFVRADELLYTKVGLSSAFCIVNSRVRWIILKVDHLIPALIPAFLERPSASRPLVLPSIWAKLSPQSIKISHDVVGMFVDVLNRWNIGSPIPFLIASRDLDYCSLVSSIECRASS